MSGAESNTGGERRMPDLARSFYGFHHTVDSALDILEKNGLASSRVTVRMAGLGAPDRWVVRQKPAPGDAIDGATKAELWVSGLGYFENLPVGMWHRGDEAEPGVDDVVRVFDDPLQKAVHWVREGARLFDVRPDNRPASFRKSFGPKSLRHSKTKMFRCCRVPSWPCASAKSSPNISNPKGPRSICSSGESWSAT